MKNPNLGRNQFENNPMFAKHHDCETRKLMSASQKLRYKNINKLLYKLREDQLNERITTICRNLLAEYKNQSH